ncbi:clavesin-2-like [Culicoides brevitarsis]|uniref:clavesin-2-like n=1 Tax=Culicoides brevitarsis TaxID=469753 RepID=UPI00307BD49D
MQQKKIDERGRTYLQIAEGFELKPEYDGVTEEYRKKAEVELRETPENVKKGIEELRELIKADANLHVPIEEEDFLIKFLRPTKFYAKSAYELIARYYKFRIRHPKYGANLVPETAKRAFEHRVINIQPRRDKYGRRILILSGAKDWTPEKFSLNELFRGVQLAVEVALVEPLTQINGCVMVFDMTGITFRQLQYCSLPFAITLIEYVQHVAPLRLKAFHVVHNPAFFNVLYKMLKPFFCQKLKTRIFFHKSHVERLASHLGPESVRPCLGGTMNCDEIDGKLFAEVMMDNSEEFAHAATFGYMDEVAKINAENLKK